MASASRFTPEKMGDLVSKDAWFDLWHTHTDWDGVGNQDAESRRHFLHLTFVGWKQIVDAAQSLSCPWQSWLVIDPQDSSVDSIYLHTPNPNRDNYPYSFEGVVWDTAPPSWLAEFIDAILLQVGRSDLDGNVLFWVRYRICLIALDPLVRPA